MTKRMYWSISIASLILIQGGSSSVALAQIEPSAPRSLAQRSTDSQPDPSTLSPSPISEPQPNQTDSLETPSTPISQEGIVPSCPAGQFASAFPDVPPDHWAYEAVNRLAAVELRCFPTSPQS